ncbi:hypothetical protein EB34_01482 [Enterococcus faecalis]|uniref:DUF1642 domain-containing protein n=1 Tax=Enterococcus faecalis TaxID=1351 RepID=UPI000DE844B0|nr:DUF1642 domain-containing protein [Enterococcus faecalis]EGO6562057.1 DUF1642 domain-containing protein [Enterococcus faecalis]RBR60693.1 hypothetical protein EB34_01482 [Enterococcus faecalis]
MNKQELIEELECLEVSTDNLDYLKGADYANERAISLAKQLDEPKKVVVPKFVAEWFENEKNSLETAINYAISLLNDDEYPFTTEFARWLDNPKNKPLETLIAMKNGYDIEKEQLYYVKLTEIGYMRFGKKYFYSTDKEDAKRYTENQIKAIDERYWPFAVKVDGE